MGSAITSFQSIVGAQSAGTADIEKMVAAFQRLAASIDHAGKKGEELNHHKGFGEFAEKIKEGIENPLKAVGSAAEGLLNSLGPVGVGIAAASGILSAAAVAGFEAAHALGEYATQVQNASIRTGLTTKEVGQFSFAAKLAGQDIGVFETAMRKLSQGMSDNSEDGKKSRDMLRQLGIQAHDSYGNLLPMSDVFLRISESLNEMHGTVNRNTAALAIFGRSGLEILPSILALEEGLQAARAAGVGTGSAAIHQMEEFHRQTVMLEAQWARTKRTVEMPVALSFVFGLKFLGKVYNDATALPALLSQLLFGGKMTATDLEMQETGGYGYGASESRSSHEREAAAVGRNDAAIRAALYSTDEEKLKQLQQKLADDQAKLKTGVLPSVNEAAFATVAADRAEIAALEGRIKATKDLEAAMKSLAAWEQQVSERELDPVSRIFAQRDVHAMATQQFDRATDAALPAASAALATMRAEYEKTVAAITNKSAAYFGSSIDGEVGQMEASRNRTVRGFLDYVNELQQTARRIDDIDLATQRGALAARAGRADRLQQLMLGPGHEAEAAVASYQIRLGLARQLYDLDVARAEREVDGGKRRIDMAKAEADLRKETYEADIERELKLAEIQRQRVDQWRSFVVGALHGIESRDLSGFLKQQASGLLDRVAGNAAEMGWKTVSGMIPHATEGSFLGKLLAGSEFGPDPMKVAGGRLVTAGDRLTMAAADLTAAARTMATSSSGGGGGLVRLSSGAVAQIGGPGYLPLGQEGSGEGGWESPGMPGGVNGDWAGESAHPAGAFNWGRAAGIGGAAVGGFYGLYSGIQSGGARGALTATGSVLAAAGSIMALASKALSVAGPIGMIAGAVLGSVIPSLFGDPKQLRAKEIDQELNDRRYRMPDSTTYTTDRYGRNFDYDTQGGLRPIIQITIPVQTMDAQSFEDRIPMIMDRVAVAVESRNYPRFESQIRRVADRA